MSTSKNFKIPADRIRDIAKGHGACLATDKIVVDGERVGFMYREEADHEADSGWRFLAGTESDDYMDESANSGVYDVNTIANYDPAIVPFLEAPVGAAFQRDDAGVLVQVEEGVSEEGESSFPVVEGTYHLTSEWSITLPGPFKRRVEEDSLVLWRPGLTAWIIAWDKPAAEAKTDRLASVKEDLSPEAFDPIEETEGGLLRFSYRLDEESSDGRAPALYAFVIGERGHVQIAIYFDDEEDLSVAQELWRSLREHPASDADAT